MKHHSLGMLDNYEGGWQNIVGKIGISSSISTFGMSDQEASQVSSDEDSQPLGCDEDQLDELSDEERYFTQQFEIALAALYLDSTSSMPSWLDEPSQAQVTHLHQEKNQEELVVQLEIQQNLVVALSQISFSAILTQLLHLEDRFRQHSEGRDEVFVTRVILSVISLILARKGDGTMSQTTCTRLFDYVLGVLHGTGATDMSDLALRCLSSLSSMNSAHLCSYLIQKMKNQSLEQQLFYNRVLSNIQFRMTDEEERNCTLLYLSSQLLYLNSTKDDPLKLQIVQSLRDFFVRVLLPEAEEERNFWEAFSQTDDATAFWKKFEEVYAALFRGSKSQSGEGKCVTFDTMGIMLALGSASFRAKNVNKFLQETCSEFRSGVQLYTIVRNLLCYLTTSQSMFAESSSEVMGTVEPLDECLPLIVEHVFPKISDLPEKKNSLQLLVDIGMEVGHRNLTLMMDVLSTILKGDFAINFKTTALVILSELAGQMSIEFTEAEYHKSLFDPIFQCYELASQKVMERDQQFGAQGDSPVSERSSGDHLESLLVAALQCLSSVEAPLDKHSYLLENIAKLSVSPVFDIAETAIYCLRDIVLINPGQHMVYVLTLLLNEMTNYFSSEEDQMQRCLYNMSILFYYINQAIEMCFDMDRVPIERFLLLRYKIEGTLLVWLCSPFSFTYSSAWRLLEQISSAQMRQLESDLDISVAPFLVDCLPRLKRNIGGAVLLDELPHYINEHYLEIFCAVNWAWSNLYEVGMQTEWPKLAENTDFWGNYLRFLCAVPRHHSQFASFEEKSHFLSSGLRGRFFTQVATIVQSSDSHLSNLVDALEEIHPSCFTDLMDALQVNLEQNNKEASTELTPRQQVAMDPSTLAVMQKAMAKMNASDFHEEQHKIESFMDSILEVWCKDSLVQHLKVLPNQAKRNLLLIAERCLTFHGDVERFLPQGTREGLEQIDQLLLILRLVTALVVEDNDASSAPEMTAALRAAGLSLVTTLLALHPVPDKNHLHVERELNSLVCAGELLPEYADTLYFTYFKRNQERVLPLLCQSVKRSPSIASSSTSKRASSQLCLPVLRAAVHILPSVYPQRTEDSQFSLTLYFVSLFFQCSFNSVLRSLAIDLLTILSLQSPSTCHELDGPSSPPVAPQDTTSKPASPFVPPTLLLTYASGDREVSLSLAENLNVKIADLHQSHSRDALNAIKELLDLIKDTEDGNLLLRFARPWVRNYGTSVANPPRWIIRALFELTEKNLLPTHVSRAEELQTLWRALVSCGDVPVVVRMATEWLFENCTQAIPKGEANSTFIRQCLFAFRSVLESCTTEMKDSLQEFLESFLHGAPLSNETDINTLYQQLSQAPEEEDTSTGFQQRTASLFLVPLLSHGRLLSSEKLLAVLLQHTVLLSDPLNPFLRISDFVLPEIVVELQNRSVHKKDNFALLYSLLFPPNPERAEETRSHRRRVTADTVVRTCFIQSDMISRLISFLSSSFPGLPALWAQEALAWTWNNTNTRQVANSFALFGCLTDRVKGSDLVGFLMVLLILLEKGQTTDFQVLSNQLTLFVQRSWAFFDHTACQRLTEFGLLLLQQNSRQCYQFGIQTLRSLFTPTNEVSIQYLRLISPHLFDSDLSLWFCKPTGHAEERDYLVLNQLIRGLEHPSTYSDTLQLLWVFYLALNSSLPSDNALRLTLLMVTFAQCILSPHNLTRPLEKLRQMNVPSLVESVERLAQQGDVDEFISHYCERFLSEFPTQEHLYFATSVLQDLIRTTDEHLQLAACQALGGLIVTNETHELTEDQCKALSMKVLLCSNSTLKHAQEAVEPLLVFLLSDERAKKTAGAFELILQPDLLRTEDASLFSSFASMKQEISPEDISTLLAAWQKYQTTSHDIDQEVWKTLQGQSLQSAYEATASRQTEEENAAIAAKELAETAQKKKLFNLLHVPVDDTNNKNQSETKRKKKAAIGDTPVSQVPPPRRNPRQKLASLLDWMNAPPPVTESDTTNNDAEKTPSPTENLFVIPRPVDSSPDKSDSPSVPAPLVAKIATKSHVEDEKMKLLKERLQKLKDQEQERKTKKS